MGAWFRESTLPYSYYRSQAVVLNNEINLVGGGATSTRKNHYKYTDNYEWVSVSTIPYEVAYGSIVVFNNEIHALGSNSSSTAAWFRYHYKYSNGSWSSVSTLPYPFYDGCAVVLGDEIHIMSSSNSSTYYKYHYKYSNGSWSSVSTLPYDLHYGSAVVLNNEIHILGGGASGSTKHYKYSNGSWVSVSTLPYNFYQGSAVVLDNEIHILGGNGYLTNHYKYSNGSWVSVSTLPYDFYYSSAVVLNNEIHILGTVTSGSRQSHYKYANPGINNVIYGDDTLIDLTKDTATPSDVLNTVMFHNVAGIRCRGLINRVAVTPDDDAPPLVTSGGTILVSGSNGYLYKNEQTAGESQIVFSATGNCAGSTSYTQYQMTPISGSNLSHRDSNYFDYNSTNYSITAKKAINGYLYLMADAGRNSSGTTIYGYVQVRKNGTSIASLNGNSTTPRPNSNTAISLAVGDVLTVYTRVSSGSANAYTNFMVVIRTGEQPSS